MKEKKEIRPRQYTHIDYEALLVYVMKNHTSVSNAIEELNLDISRSAVVRNIRKIKQEDPKNEIVILYQEGYVPNMQKDKIPEELEEKIEQLESSEVVIKDKLEDLYNKLTTINNVIEACNGNCNEATIVINRGYTPLGNIKISRQGLSRIMKNYGLVKEKYEEHMKEKKDNSEREK